jgi:hypothetical protein
MKPVKSLVNSARCVGKASAEAAPVAPARPVCSRYWLPVPFVAQQLHGRGLALDQRILQQVGAHEIATAQAHVHIQHIGAHVQHGRCCECRFHCGRSRHGRYGAGTCGRCGCRSGFSGRRLRHRGRQRIAGFLFGRGLDRRLRSGRIALTELCGPGLVVHEQGQQEADPQNGAQVFHGTGSIPPSLKGWQRRIRLVVSDSPFSGPCLSIASCA